MGIWGLQNVEIWTRSKKENIPAGQKLKKTVFSRHKCKNQRTKMHILTRNRQNLFFQTTIHINYETIYEFYQAI